MKEFIISLNDRGEKGDITKHLCKVLDECKRTDGAKIIRFEKGEYHFYADFAKKQILYASNTDSHRYPEKYIAVDIDAQKELTLEGNGAMFIFHGTLIPFKVTGSENITLRNFSWDFPVAGTLECEVIGSSLFYTDFAFYKNCQWEIKGKDILWYETSPFSGEKYWQNKGQTECHCVVCNDRENESVARFPVTSGPFFAVRKIRRLSENSIRVYYYKPTPKIHRKGMIFEICPNYNRDCVGSFFCDSKGIVAENVNVHYMHGFGWLTQMCENVSFVGCNFTPRMDSERYCTSFADLLHVSGAKGKIHIESCKFSNAHDDPINIHGTYTRVKTKLDPHTLRLEYVHNQQRGFTQYHQGDKVVFYLRKDFTGLEAERTFTVISVSDVLCEGNSDQEMTVTFLEELPDELSHENAYVCENVSYTPEVYIGNCRFEKIPTRGVLCTTRKKAVIENNIFNGITMASIYISNDCNDWYESGPVRDMTIRNNKFYIKESPYKGRKPGIFIDPIVADGRMCPQIHSGITVENNEFYLDGEKALFAKHSKNMIIRNNIVYSSDRGSPFELENCENPILENNKVLLSAET